MMHGQKNIKICNSSFAVIDDIRLLKIGKRVVFGKSVFELK